MGSVIRAPSKVNGTRYLDSPEGSGTFSDHGHLHCTKWTWLVRRSMWPKRCVLEVSDLTHIRFLRPVASSDNRHSQRCCQDRNQGKVATQKSGAPQWCA